MRSQYDVVIVGAGPTGLLLACALADAGFTIAVLDREPCAALANPAPDGREIALTHGSVDVLQSLGVWQRFAAAEVTPIREARVLNGTSPDYLSFDTEGSGLSALGFIVSNHIIRRAAYDAVQSRSGIALLDAVRVAELECGPESAQIQLTDGRTVCAPLIVAADGRFSETRRRAGIGAQTRDFGRTMIVCRLAHDGPPDDIAYECFGYDRTLAILPLQGQLVSAVVTVPSNQADSVLHQTPEEYATACQSQFGPHLGRLRLAGERHAYPLVAVYADRFVAHRIALLGDAAVGMHPVTAHGFNLGLYGVDTLARVLAAARSRGRDIGCQRVLSHYDTEHRRTTWPLYQGTNALVSLFTDNRLPARIARGAVLHLAQRLPPLKLAITQRLTDARKTSLRRQPPIGINQP